MGIDFTVDSAVLRVRRKLQLRAVNDKLTTAEIIQIMDEEIQSRLFPLLCQCVEDYAVEWGPAHIAAGFFQARIPALATSATVQSVRIVRSSDGREMEMTRVPLNELPTQVTATNQLSTDPVMYALDGASIVVFPQPLAAVTLRVLYQRRPSRLVPTSDCVAAIVQGPYGTITVSSYGALVGYQAVDAVAGSPPLGVYESYLSIGPTSTPPLSIDLKSYDPEVGTFTTMPHNLTGFAQVTAPGGSAYSQSNDWLTPTGFTCVFPLPEAWYPAWITSSASTVAQETGDAEVAMSLRAEADALLMNLQQHQANRARSQPIAVFNRKSPLRLGRRIANTGWGGF